MCGYGTLGASVGLGLAPAQDAGRPPGVPGICRNGEYCTRRGEIEVGVFCRNGEYCTRRDEIKVPRSSPYPLPPKTHEPPEHRGGGMHPGGLTLQPISGEASSCITHGDREGSRHGHEEARTCLDKRQKHVRAHASNNLGATDRRTA